MRGQKCSSSNKYRQFTLYVDTARALKTVRKGNHTKWSISHRCLHESMLSAKFLGKWKMESGGWTCGYIQRPQGFRPPRRRAGSQQIWITSNGPGTLLKDRCHHPHFTGQEIWAVRGQVIGSPSQGSEWSWDSNSVLHLSVSFLLHLANPCGNFWI